MNVFEGKLVPEQIKIGIVAARFNEFITSRLLGGALDGLKRHNVPEDNIDVAWVPGAFEIPLIASKMAASKKYDAVICLGAVIRGSTSHYHYPDPDPAQTLSAGTADAASCGGDIRLYDGFRYLGYKWHPRRSILGALGDLRDRHCTGGLRGQHGSYGQRRYSGGRRGSAGCLQSASH